MKSKRLLSILLVAVMLFSTVVMSGCSSTNNEEDAANSTSTRTITTLSMYIITGDETDPVAADKVQMELNRILLPEYKTMVKIHYLKADEYWDVVDGMLEETDPAKDVLPGGKIDPESLVPATVVGTENLGFNKLIDYIFDDSTTQIELTKPQIDLFVVNDYDKYLSLVDEQKILSLNSYLDYDSKILTKYIYPTFLSAARVGKDIYGIPTNKALTGCEYTYFVFNKDLIDKYGFNVKELSDYNGNKFREYMKVIKTNEPEVWPVSGACDVAGLEIYDGSFTTISSAFNAVGTGCNASFMEAGYMDNLAVIKEFKELGYYPAEPVEGAKYAIEIQYSDKLEEREFVGEDGTNYVRYLYDIPRVTVEDAFTSVMCVSYSSPVPDRAMELITLFNTNSELANLLQYGIEDINYNYDSFEDSISMIGNSYVMDNNITGNTYIKYPPNNDHDYVENAKKVNLGTAPSALLGLVPTFESKTQQSDFECVKAVLQTARQAVLDGRDLAEVRNIINKELVLLGYGYAGTTELAGIFGKIQSLQGQQAKLIAKNFGISDEILKYNEPYGVVLESVVIEEAPAPTEGEEGVEGEGTEGEDVAAVESEAEAE